MGDVTKMDDAYLWHITKIGQAFNISRDTVRKRLVKSNVQPVKNIKGAPHYRLSDIGPALFDPTSSITVDGCEPSKLPPKDRKDFYQSENERLKFESADGQLIPVEDVRAEQVAIMKTVVAFFEGLPDKMERKRLFSPEQLNALEKFSDQMRDQLHLELTSITHGEED